MSSDSNFTVASWFLGNVHIKPISTHSGSKKTPKTSLRNTSMFQSALTDRDMQARFCFRVVWEFWVVDLHMTLCFGQK